MEIKPIKRNKNIAPISREHHATLLFCWKIRQGLALQIDKARINRYIQWFRENHLLPHFKTEEKYLFFNPDDALVSKALQEHSLIIELMDRINEADHQVSETDLISLATLVNDHTRYEERVVFPHLEQTFTRNRLIQIGESLAQEEHSAVENYPDTFWIKEKHKQ